MEHQQESEQQLNKRQQHLLMATSTSTYLNPPIKSNFERAKELIDQGKENQKHDQIERFCFECNRSLAKSRHLINIAGQMHKWHPECFKCHLCSNPMDKESSCHIYKDKIVCRQDYAKLQRDNLTKCSRCQWPIAASDWVRKAGDHVYHLACFSCDICMRQLSTGEQFTISVEDKSTVKLLCRLHFSIEQNQSDTNEIAQSPFDFTCSGSRLICSSSAKSDSNLNHRDQYLHLLASTSASTSQTPNILDRQTVDFDESKWFTCSSIDNLSAIIINAESVNSHLLNDDASKRAGASNLSSNGSNSGCGGLMGLPSKSKRVRTTFTEDQLSILQTHFQIDSNPDGQDLERIATITGLSKRVTQVWFQNSRARQKKYMIKRKPSSSSSNATSSVSIGLAGGSSCFTQHQRQIQLHGYESSIGANGELRYQSSVQHKWPTNLSDDRSDISLDESGAIEDLDDTSRSSSNDQVVSDESNE